MKKLLLLFLAPFLMATQCDDDQGLQPITDYFIQNNTSVELVFITTSGNEEPIVIDSELVIGSSFDADESVPPSQTASFDSIKLYTLNAEGTLVLAYEQDPIDDDLWILTNPTNSEFVYTLVITDELID